MTLGKKLKRARIRKNLTQEYLAGELEISQKTYSNFENDKSKPDFQQIETISKLLDTSILEFLTNDGMSFNYENVQGGNNGFIYQNYLSETLVKQYEMHIKFLEEEVNFLRNLLKK